MPTPITSIGQIAIPVHDIDRAVTFFRDPDRNVHGLMAEVR